MKTHEEYSPFATLKNNKKGESTMKTPEELNALKEEFENLKIKLAELTDEELAQVSGGVVPRIEYYKPVDKVPDPDPDVTKYRPHLDD